MPSNLVPLRPANAEEHARAETTRKQRLFDWADGIFVQLGLADEVRTSPTEVKVVLKANTLEELRRVKFDENASAVELLIRDALHPESGTRADHFVGLNKVALKRLLKTRFEEKKREREAELRNGTGAAGSRQSAYNWTDDLKLDDDGAVLPILHNQIGRAWDTSARIAIGAKITEPKP